MKNIRPNNLCIGILRAPADTVKNALNHKLSLLNIQMKVDKDVIVNWEEFFEERGRSFDVLRAQYVITPLTSDTTIYTCNLSDGWLSLYSKLVEDNKINAGWFRRSFDNCGRFDLLQMSVWQLGEKVRDLKLIDSEDGLRFINRGPLLEFEDMQNYKRRRLRDRVNEDNLKVYSAKYGFDMNYITSCKIPSYLYHRV